MGQLLTVPRVAFDEAGNTGANLLDDNQPVFVLASVLATDEIAAIALGERELKFSSLRKSAAGRAEILRVLNHVALEADNCLISGFHKEFMAVTKIVDLLYEPLAYASGLDLYERGANIAMANLLFFTLPTFVGRPLFSSLLECFVTMVRKPSGGNIDRFYQVVQTAYDVTSPDGLKDELGALRLSRALVETNPDSFHASSLDPAIPAFFFQASEWTARLKTPFDIIHDSSKPLENQQLVLEAMMSTSELPKTIGYDRRKMSFPLSATGIQFRDSALEPTLQVADIVASAAGYVSRSTLARDNDRFGADLLTTRVLGDASWRPVWPQLKFAPRELDTDEAAPRLDPHNHVGEYVSHRLGGIPPISGRKKAPEQDG